LPSSEHLPPRKLCRKKIRIGNRRTDAVKSGPAKQKTLRRNYLEGSYHRGITLNFPLGALAHLGLARAYALQGDTAKAKAAYNDFFALWKDADPDIPILQQAKAEYAKLK
jgi:hypothetical protein